MIRRLYPLSRAFVPGVIGEDVRFGRPQPPWRTLEDFIALCSTLSSVSMASLSTGSMVLSLVKKDSLDMALTKATSSRFRRTTKPAANSEAHLKKIQSSSPSTAYKPSSASSWRTVRDVPQSSKSGSGDARCVVCEIVNMWAPFTISPKHTNSTSPTGISHLLFIGWPFTALTELTWILHFLFVIVEKFSSPLRRVQMFGYNPAARAACQRASLLWFRLWNPPECIGSGKFNDCSSLRFEER